MSRNLKHAVVIESRGASLPSSFEEEQTDLKS